MASAKGDIDKDRAELLKLIRSVLLPKGKDGMSIRSLNSDYRSFMGHDIDFKKFGYRTIEDLLRSMPDTVYLKRNYNGETFCVVVTEEKTQHISSLVSRTKAAKPRKSNRRRVRTSPSNNLIPYRKSSHSFNNGQRYPPNRRGSSFNPSNNRSYYQPSNRNPQTQRQQAATNHNHYEPPPRFKSQQSNEEPTTSGQSGLVNGGFKTEPRKQEIPMTNGKEHRQTSAANCDTKKIGNSQTAFAKLKQQAANEAQYVQQTPQQYENLAKPLSPCSPTWSEPLSPHDFSYSPSPHTFKNFSITVPNRVISPDATVISPDTRLSPEPITPVPKPETFVQMIENYARKKGIVAHFKTFPHVMKRPKQKPLTMYLSTLTLADYKFQSYPDEKPTPEEADEEAARKAVEELKLDQMDPFEDLPIAPHQTENDIKIMMERIGEIIAPKRNGIIHLNVQRKYQENHKESLPSHWLDIVKERKICKKVDSVTGEGEVFRYILYPLTSGTASPTSLGDRSTPSDNRPNSSLETSPPLYEIPLPEDDQWEVYVSHVVNTMNVYIRLVDYSQEFEELSNKMEQYYNLRNYYPLLEVVVGEYYAFYEENTWHRVQVFHIEGEGVDCFFPDHGDVDRVHVSQLRELHRKFLDVPFQAISCQLTGIEYLADDENLTERLIELVSYKTLVAEVKSRDGDNPSLILYDTSTDDDVNLNKDLLDYALNVTLKPTLPTTIPICEGYLSHVNNSGDISLRTNMNGLSILDVLIRDLAGYFKENLGKVSIETILVGNMYMAKGVEGRWCRCLVLELPKVKPLNAVTVNFIDYGIVQNIPLSSLVEITGVSDVLLKFPSQVISCQLHDVPTVSFLKWTVRTSNKLLEMVSPNQLLSIKVIPSSLATNQIIPQVQLFKRNDQEELISLNQTLALTPDLFDNESEVDAVGPIFKRSNSSSTGSTFDTKKPNIALTDTSSSYTSVLSSKFQSLNLLQSPIDGSGDIDLDGPPLIPVETPEVGEIFDVVVLWAAKPNLFFVQSRKERKEFSFLFHEMQQFYNTEENVLDFEMCLLNSRKFYAIKHKDDNWYRGWVTQIHSMEPVIVVAYLVDYGEFVQVPVSCIQQLWKRFRTLPFQAIKAKLHGVSPLSYDYSIEHIDYFQELVNDKEFVSIIESKVVDKSLELGGYELSLTLIDTSTKEDIYIGQCLIDKGYAKVDV